MTLNDEWGGKLNRTTMNVWGVYNALASALMNDLYVTKINKFEFHSTLNNKIYNWSASLYLQNTGHYVVP